MAVMTHEFSHFPDSIYTLHHFENVADASSMVIDKITEIKSYVATGKYAEAAAVLAQYRSMLSRYWIDADIINAIEEEIRNLEIYAKGVQQAYYCQSAKPDANEGDVWIG